jgi:hypothetical protein
MESSSFATYDVRARADPVTNAEWKNAFQRGHVAPDADGDR